MHRASGSVPPRRLSRLLAGVGLLAALGIAVPGCGSGAPGGGNTSPARPALTLSACTVSGSLHARCGTLRVAEDPARPQGRQIGLRVVVLPAQGTVHLPDPLLYFAGYGGAASEDAAWVMSHFWRLNQTRDIVLVDQRGTGGSNRMECTGLGGLDQSSSDAAMAAAADACLASVRDRGDPRLYTTPIAVDDVDTVRAALGYDRVNVYGGSYGVSSGLAYIQRHGAHVRAALFDSGSLLDTRLWELGGRSAQQALAAVLARCAEDTRCNAAFPHLAAEWDALMARLAASPPSVQVTDPSTGQPATVVVERAAFLGLVSDTYLGSVQSAAGLPRLVHRAFLGEWAALVQEVAATQAGRSDPRSTLVSSHTIACSDEWAAIDPAGARAAGGTSPFTDMVLQQARFHAAVCARWPAAAGVRGTVTTNAPVVFLNGTADPADPPANVAAAAATMPGSLVVPVVGYGHGQLGQDESELITSEANTFLQSGRPSTLDDWPAAAHPWMPPFVVA